MSTYNETCLQSRSFGQLLRHYREKRLLGVSELARQASVSKSIVSMLEWGARKRPGFRVLRGLCNALDLNGAERQILVDAALGHSAIPVAASTWEADGDKALQRAIGFDEHYASKIKLPPVSEEERAFLDRCLSTRTG